MNSLEYYNIYQPQLAKPRMGTSRQQLANGNYDLFYKLCPLIAEEYANGQSSPFVKEMQKKVKHANETGTALSCFELAVLVEAYYGYSKGALSPNKENLPHHPTVLWHDKSMHSPRRADEKLPEILIFKLESEISKPKNGKNSANGQYSPAFLLDQARRDAAKIVEAKTKEAEDQAADIIRQAKEKAREIVEQAKLKAGEKAQQEYDRIKAEADEYDRSIRAGANNYVARTEGKANEYYTQKTSAAEEYYETTKKEADDYSKQIRQEADDYSEQIKQAAAIDAEATREDAEKEAKSIRAEAKQTASDAKQTARETVQNADYEAADIMKSAKEKAKEIKTSAENEAVAMLKETVAQQRAQTRETAAAIIKSEIVGYNAEFVELSKNNNENNQTLEEAANVCKREVLTTVNRLFERLDQWRHSLYPNKEKLCINTYLLNYQRWTKTCDNLIASVLAEINVKKEAKLIDEAFGAELVKRLDKLNTYLEKFLQDYEVAIEALGFIIFKPQDGDLYDPNYHRCSDETSGEAPTKYIGCEIESFTKPGIKKIQLNGEEEVIVFADVVVKDSLKNKAIISKNTLANR